MALVWRDLRLALTPRRALAAVAILAALLSLVLHAAIPIAAETYLIHDDALFVRLAQSILRGEWLGPFDNLTLAKGPFYSIFIAGAHLLGLPLLLAQQVVRLVASALAGFALARLATSRAVGMALFAALALDPTFMHPALAHVIREGLYSSLGLALIALAALAVFDKGAGLSWRRMALLVSFGLVFAAYWLTREESVWLYPSFAVIAAAGLAQATAARRAAWQRAWRPFALSLTAQSATAVAAFAVFAGGVAALNNAYYGRFITNEFRDGAFASAYGAIQRIAPKQWTPYLVFDEDVAARAYATSAAARELKVGFDGPNGAMWRDIGCKALSLSPCPNAYARGWFMWALRDAVLLAGHYKTEAEAQAFFLRLAREVNAACDAGRIACMARRDIMAPPFSFNYLSRAPRPFLNALAILAQLRPVRVGALASQGPADRIEAFARIVGPVAAPAPMALTGWVASRVCVPRPRVAAAGNRTVLARASYEEAKDIEAHFAKAGATVPATRFRIETDCRAASCELLFNGCAPIAPQPLAALVPGWLTGTGEVLVRLDAFDSAPSAEPVAPAGAASAVMWALAEIYRVFVPLLLAAGIVGVVVAAVRRRHLWTDLALTALTLAACGAVLARAVLITSFDISSAYVVNELYLSPAAPFVLLFGFAGASLGLRSWR